MIRAIKAFALIGTLALGACETTGGPPSIVCTALIAPIRYNSANINSPRHAGPALAPDLAVRNRIGQNLGCKEFR